MAFMTADQVRDIGRRGNRFLCVVDADHTPKQGEVLLKVKNKAILVKDPKAFELRNELAKKLKDENVEENLKQYISGMIFSAVSAVRSGNIGRIEKSLEKDRKILADTMLTPIVSHLRWKKLKSDQLRNKKDLPIYDEEIDNSSFSDMYQQMWDERPFEDYLNGWIDDIRNNPDQTSNYEAEIQYSILKLDFPSVYETYVHYMKKFDYDVFSVEKVGVGEISITNSPTYQSMLDTQYDDSEVELEKYLALICCDPYYKNGQILASMAMELGNRTMIQDIKDLASFFIPHLEVTWQNFIVTNLDRQYTDRVTEADNSPDREEKLKKLADEMRQKLRNAGVEHSYDTALREYGLLKAVERALGQNSYYEQKIQDAMDSATNAILKGADKIFDKIGEKQDEKYRKESEEKLRLMKADVTSASVKDKFLENDFKNTNSTNALYELVKRSASSVRDDYLKAIDLLRDASPKDIQKLQKHTAILPKGYGKTAFKRIGLAFLLTFILIFGCIIIRDYGNMPEMQDVIGFLFTAWFIGSVLGFIVGKASFKKTDKLWSVATVGRTQLHPMLQHPKKKVSPGSVLKSYK